MRKTLINEKHGALVVIEELADEFRFGRNRRVVKAKCECGNIVKYDYDSLISRESCGCKKKKRISRQFLTHGLTKHPLFLVWQNMKNRCYNNRVWAYQYYGAKGIGVCAGWLNDFKSFFDWSISSGWDHSLTLDRHPNKQGNYSPENCRWATQKEQCNNTSRNIIISYNGEENTLSFFSGKFNIPYKLLYSRIKKLKWDTAKAIEAINYRFEK